MKIKYTLCLLIAVIFVSCAKAPRVIITQQSETWMGIYIQNSKIGYSFSRIQKSENHYRLTNRMKINLSMMGQTEQVVSEFISITDQNFVLQQFEFDFQSLNRQFRAVGEIKQNQLMIEVVTGGEKRKDKREISEPVYPVMVLGTVALQKQFKIGKKYTIKVFDPTALSINEAEVRLTGKDKVLIRGTEYDLNKIEILLFGLTTTIWVDDNGITRKEMSVPGITSIEESREEALAAEKIDEKLDILTLFSVPVDTVITEPRAVRYLKLEISNIDTIGLMMRNDFQSIVQTDPLVIEIKSLETINQVSLPISGQAEYLKPSLYIQSDNAEIIKKSRDITGAEKNATNASKKITRWVFDNVAKRATASLPSALDVLKNLEGDCNEHAILFTALCRAAGIPTQICVGLVYVDNRFYYHAWNKV
ncbi:MAG: transglutaminase domain-containing protein, partial [Candidatus Latescibacteria bacterium]|nr:transglutaminase domain-containing protein [Candidatus Latescibacterota bacterium]